MRRTSSIRIGPAPVDAARISYAGELGWELTTSVAWAVTVWDRLRAAGAEFDLEPLGYRALDALRMEKGYRYFGTDLTMLDTPFEAGLGAFVRLDEGPVHRPRGARRRRTTAGRGFVASEPCSSAARTTNRSTAARPSASTAMSSVDSEASPTARRRAHDRLRLSAATMPEGADLDVDVFDRRVSAVIAPDVVVDPPGERMRG